MAEVVIKMITFGLEDVVIFIFNFPTSPSDINKRDDGLSREVMIGCKGVVVELFTGFAVGDGHFAPINQQGIHATPEGNILNETTGDNFGEAAIKAA